jgi:hypothetical protein
MKKTLTTYDIAHELLQDGGAAWTYAGAFALAEHLQQCEEDSGEEMELDVVAIRSDFSEYKNLIDFAYQYTGKSDFWPSLGIDLDGDEEEDEKLDLIRSFINDHGTLIGFSGGIIVSSF